MPQLTNNTAELLQHISGLQDSTTTFNEPLITQEIKESRSSVMEGLGIKVLSIIGGFISCLLLLGLLALGGLFDSAAATTLVGIIMIAGAVLADKLGSRVLDAAAISFYITGVVMVGMALDISNDNHSSYYTTAILYLIISIVVFTIAHSSLISFISVLLFNGSVLYLCSHFQPGISFQLMGLLFAAAYVLLSLYESSIITMSPWLNRRYPALRTGFLLSLVLLLVLPRQFANAFLWYYQVHHYYYVLPYVSWAGFTAALAFPVYHIAGYHTQVSQRLLFTALAVVLVLPAINAPYIPAALLVLALSIHTGYRTGLGLGIILFIWSVSRFYYDMQFTLLVKSGILFATGLFFIVGWLLLKKHYPTHEKL